jgi:hydrogenase maturation protease
MTAGSRTGLARSAKSRRAARFSRPRRRGTVQRRQGGTGGVNLLACFREYPCVILIDATLDGRPPGTVAALQPRFLSEYPRSLSAHDVGLRDLLETAALLGPLPRLHLVTISIAQVDSATIELTRPVQQAIPAALESTRQILRQEGIT